MATNSNTDSNQAKINRLRKIADLIRNKEMLGKIGLAYQKFVRVRTQKGIDVHGKSFAEYVKPYAQRRKRMGEPVHPVNLTLDHYSGMISQIDHIVFADLDGIKAYVKDVGDPSKADLAKWHQTGAGNSPVREWWGLTNKHKEKIEGIITTSLDEIFEKQL